MARFDDGYEEFRERMEKLEVANGVLEAQIDMTVARLGGLVEGNQTSSLNFLQRIDALVEMEKKYATKCPRCDGTGKYWRFLSKEKPCSVCNGTGKV